MNADHFYALGKVAGHWLSGNKSQEHPSRLQLRRPTLTIILGGPLQVSPVGTSEASLLGQDWEWLRVGDTIL